MLPGYGDGEPYFSPIFVRSATPVPGDPNLQEMEFHNLLYAAGVQDFRKILRPVLWADTYLLTQLIEPEASGEVRAAVISTITFDWLQRCCPEVMDLVPRSKPDGIDLTVQASLTAAYGLG